MIYDQAIVLSFNFLSSYSRCCPHSNVIDDKVENNQKTSSFCARTKKPLESCNGEPPKYETFNTFNNRENREAQSNDQMPSRYTSTCVS